MRSVVNVTPRPLYPWQRDCLPIVQEAGWVPESVWTGAEYLAPTGIGSPYRPVCNESLYRLGYPGPLFHTHTHTHKTTTTTTTTTTTIIIIIIIIIIDKITCCEKYGT
jgi:hypothetical protein